MPTSWPHEEKCRRCGSTYWVTSTKIPMRDQDSISCEVCGEQLISWNQARMFEARLTQRAGWPPKSPE
jgi:hypothetical protein